MVVNESALLRAMREDYKGQGSALPAGKMSL